MTANVLDPRQHAAVIRPLLEVALAGEENGDQRLYDYGEVPGADGNDGKLPEIFATLTIERRYAPPNRVGRPTNTGWRITIRYAALVVDEARWAAMQVMGAINNIQVTIAGVETTPIVFETETAIAPDSGRQSGLLQFTYAL